MIEMGKVKVEVVGELEKFVVMVMYYVDNVV